MSGKRIAIAIGIFFLGAHVALLGYLGIIKLNATANYDGVSVVSGTVRDHTGAILPGAWVVLDNGRGNKYVTKTNPLGGYSFIAIVPSSYTLTITSKGFAIFTQQVEVIAKRTVSVDVTLQVLIGRKLQVKSRPPDSAEPDKNLSSIASTVKDLQAIPSDPSAVLEELGRTACPSCPDEVAFYVNGLRSDGSGKTSRIPPKEAVEVIRAGASPYAAEFQELRRGPIEIVTKPGSDGFHADATVRFNDESLNARNALAESRAPLQVRDYSGYFTGPIVRNRLDLLAYAGRFEHDLNAVINTTAIDLNTFLPQPFARTVVTPFRTTNLTLHANYLASNKQTVGIEYARTSDRASNQGLESGFDLPDRAFSRSSTEDALRFSLASVLSERTLNESRFEISRRNYGTQSLSGAPAVTVLDAYNTGGNPSSLLSNNLNHSLQLADNLTRTINRHTLKMGLLADALFLTSNDRANFNGTFTFGTDINRDVSGKAILDRNGRTAIVTPFDTYGRTLMGLPGYGPSLFSIAKGNPEARISQWQIGFFIQDEWRISPRLTLSYGLRHDLQTHLGDKNNVAPRVGVAWVPDKGEKGTVRAGAGIFYSTVFSGITLTTTRFDGQRQQELRIQQPQFFAEIPATLDGSIAAQQTIYRKAPGLKAPYSFISHVSYERQLPWKMFGAISYSWQHGVNLLRTRNLNAAGGPTLDGSPGDRLVLEYQSTGTSSRHELLLTLRGQIGNRVTLFSNYALSVTRSDTDGPDTSPASYFDLLSEYGYASLDQRHSFYFGATLSLPWAMSVSPFLSLSSGQPFNITTGRDNNGDTIFTDRPAFAASSDPRAIGTPFGLFNPDPLPGALLIPRNFARATGLAILNLGFSKTFTLRWPSKNRTAGPGASTAAGRNYSLVFDANVQNLLNHANFTGYNGVLTTPLFAVPNRALDGRKVEFSLRFTL